MKALIVSSQTSDVVAGSLRLGGPALYAGRALALLGAEVVALVASGGPLGGLYLSELRRLGVEPLALECSDPPTFFVEGGRAAAARGGCKLGAEAIVDVLAREKPDLVLLSPVLGEISPAGAALALSRPELSRSVSAVDIQGFVRSVGKGGKLSCSWSSDVLRVAESASLVHGNVSEFCFASSEEEVVEELAKASFSLKAILAATADSRGLYLAAKGAAYKLGALPVDALDEVGAGDVFTAVAAYYLARGRSALEAAALGAAAAALKVSRPGAERWFGEEELLELARRVAAEPLSARLKAARSAR